MKKLKVLGLLVAGFLAFGLTVQAAEFIAPQSKADANVSTLSQEVHKNLYVAGGSVTINGKTLGDLFAAGGMVTVNGDVEKDLMAAGGNININGTVGQNLRVGGGNISINGPVAGDLLIGGGNVTVAQKATVGGDLVAGSGNISIDSDVKGNVKIGGGTVTINAKITGNVDVMASNSLTFGPASQVLGKVTYKGPSAAVVKPGAKVGVIDYTQVQRRMHHEGGFIGLLVISSLLKLLMLLAAGLVFAWLLPAKTSTVVRQALGAPLHSLGLGILVLVVSPILGLLLSITVVGLYLGIIVFLIFGLLIMISSVLTAFYVGNLVWGWIKKDHEANRWIELLIGVGAMFVLGLIPIIGWIALLILWLITLGALVVYWKKDNLQN